jgi:hypothetical protein
MKLSGTIVGVLLVVVGSVWFFQGIGKLPGSFMTGQTKWAVYGAIAFLAGIVIVFFSRRA